VRALAFAWWHDALLQLLADLARRRCSSLARAKGKLQFVRMAKQPLLQIRDPGDCCSLQSALLMAGSRWGTHKLLVAGGVAGHEGVFDGALARYVERSGVTEVCRELRFR
jgi:hypothetical protein